MQSVEALPGHRLRLGLSDGRTIERDFAAELAGPTGPMNAPLKDPQFFAQVRFVRFKGLRAPRLLSTTDDGS